MANEFTSFLDTFVPEENPDNAALNALLDTLIPPPPPAPLTQVNIVADGMLTPARKPEAPIVDKAKKRKNVRRRLDMQPLWDDGYLNMMDKKPGLDHPLIKRKQPLFDRPLIKRKKPRMETTKKLKRRPKEEMKEALETEESVEIEEAVEIGEPEEIEKLEEIEKPMEEPIKSEEMKIVDITGNGSPRNVVVNVYMCDGH